MPCRRPNFLSLRRWLRVATAAMLPLAASCDGATECTPTEASCLADAPVSLRAASEIIRLRPSTTIQWTGQEGDNTPIETTVEVRAGTQTGLEVSVGFVGPPEDWATATLTRTTSPANVIISLTPGSLPPGTHVVEWLVSSSTSVYPGHGRGVLEIKPSAFPAAPTDLTATTLDVVRIQLDWSDKSDDETVFRIERSAVGGPFTEFRTVRANETLFVDALWGHTETDFTYRLRACNDSGCSAYSNPATASILGPPIVEFHPSGLSFAVPADGTQPPPADLWAVNVGNTAPDAFFLGRVDGDVGVSVRIAEGSLEPGDSLRVHIETFVPTGPPVLQPTAIGFEMKVGDLLQTIFTSVEVTFTTPPLLLVAGGTVDGLLGTFIVWDAVSFDFITTVFGPPGWNGNQPLDLEPHQPIGMGGTLAYAMSGEATPVSGNYTAVVPDVPRVGEFAINAELEIPTPTIVSTSITPERARVQWTGYPQHRSTIVKIRSVQKEPLGEFLVGPGVTEFTFVGPTWEPGRVYEFEVIAVSEDLTNAGLLSEGSGQIDAARAVASDSLRADIPATTLSIEAHIDGRSRLTLQGSTAQWHHLDFAAPGRHDPVDAPTIFNGTEWFPVWPDVPDRQNRGCDCVSDVFLGVSPALPAGDPSVRLVSGRGSMRIVQQPDPSNGFTLVIEFDDTLADGPAWYVADLVFE